MPILYYKMNYWCKILIEAFVVALSVVVLGFGIQRVFKINNPLESILDLNKDEQLQSIQLLSYDTIATYSIT